MRERKINIEFIRLFAAFMTVMIHVSNFYINHFGKISALDFFASVTYNSLSRICVPLFFMVSGIFLVKQEFNKRKYLERIIRFAVILLVWSVVYYLFENGLDFDSLGEVLVSSIFNANQTSRHLWFLYAIIGIYIALPFISNMCKNLTPYQENLFLILWFGFSGLIVVAVPLARLVTKTNIDVSYPIPIVNSTYYLGYFIGGHILYERFKHTKADKKKNLLCLAGYLVPTLVNIFLMYFVSVTNGEFFEPLTWYRSAFIAIAAFSVFIFVVINDDKIKSRHILKISRYSFGIYLMHMIIFKLIVERVDILNWSPIIAIPLLTAVVYLVSLLCSIILSKIPILKRLI